MKWFLNIALILTSVFSCFEKCLLAQNDADLFRFSKHFHGGSARFEAMGGAFGALGADISAVQINPAGIGRFSSSQVNFSMRPTFDNMETVFASTTSRSQRSSFATPSMGLVFTNDVSGNNKGNLYSQFAFGMNKIEHYYYKTKIQGQQFPSLLEEFMEQAKGVDPSNLVSSFPFTTSLAWETYAIDYDPDSMYYYSYLNSGNVNMLREAETKGGIQEIFFSYSVNRLNKLYWGFSINARQYRLSESYTHTESLTIPDPDFVRFDYKYSLSTKGSGVNLKLGFIYLITDSWRVGASFHSPTYINLKDEWNADMSTTFKISGYKTTPIDMIPIGDYRYRMVTPLKTVLSMSGIIGMNIALSADIEYINYQTAQLRSTNNPAYSAYDFKNENNEAKQRLDKSFNYRLGAEYNLYHRWFFRVGYSSYANGYKKSEQVDPKPDIAISCGIGYRINLFSLDLAYVNRQMERYYYPFSHSEVARTKREVSNFILTTTFRF